MAGKRKLSPKVIALQNEIITEMWNFGLTSRNIGFSIGLSQSGVRERVRKLGLPKRRQGGKKVVNGRIEV